MEPIIKKQHSITRVTSVTLEPQESFVEAITIINNRKVNLRMKSTPGFYYAIDIKPSMARELIKIAKEGGSLGTYYNKSLRNLPYEKVEG